jgi:hypothetical protein
MKQPIRKISSENVENTESTVLEDILNDAVSLCQENHSRDVAKLPLCGVVTERRNSANGNRLLVRWEETGDTFERWLHPLKGVSAAIGDTVIIQHLSNQKKPIITGVLETDDDEAAAESTTSVIRLTQGNTILIETNNGVPLLEISHDNGQPSVKLLTADTAIDLPGELAISADAIRLEARTGKAEVTATDDVVVKGKLIHLN